MTRAILICLTATLLLSACAAPRAARKTVGTAVKATTTAGKLTVRGARTVTRLNGCAEDENRRKCRDDD